jgi:hypothetical protein
MQWKKLVVRNLPHDVSCEEALSLCGFSVPEPVPASAEEGGLSKQGKYKTGLNPYPSCPEFFRWEAGQPPKSGRMAVPPRLYLQFRKDPAQLAVVQAALNGKTVTTANGTSCVLDVGIAPNQKLPRDKRRRDNKMNTISRDPDFLVFLEELKNPDKDAAAVPFPTEEDTVEKAKPVAALVQFLNERRLNKTKVRFMILVFISLRIQL